MRLSAPSTLRGDPSAVEVLRVWLGEDEIHCAADLGLGMEHPGESEWGVLLARVVRRLGRLVEAHDGTEADAAVTDIVDAFLEEISRSTADPEDEL